MITFDIKALENKIFFAIISILVFTLVYSCFPISEMAISEPNPSLWDIVYISTITQFSSFSPVLMRPVSSRVKMILLLQLFVTFCIIAA
jgi:hypothetical protein